MRAIKKQIESYGYKTIVQVFPYKNTKVDPLLSDDPKSFWNIKVSKGEKAGESQNLIVIKKPITEDKKDIIIVCANYDSLSKSGGAIDNGSGVAVIMEVARQLENISNNVELRFVFLGGGCKSFYGARYYISQLSEDEKENIKAVINLNNFGYKKFGQPIIGTSDGKENEATLLFKEQIKNKKIELKKIILSDYYAFKKAGIPALAVGQFAFEPGKVNYDIDEILKSDKITQVDSKKLKFVADMIIESLLQYTKK